MLRAICAHVMPYSPWVPLPFIHLAALAFSLNGTVALPAQEVPVHNEPRSAAQGLNPALNSDPGDRSRFFFPPTSHYYSNLPYTAAVPLLFLPPDVPVLDTPIPLRSPLDNGTPPPAELANHVGDLFYPQLATRLAVDGLPRRLRLKLEAYRQLKHSLLDELEAEIAAARDLPRERRRADLATLAAGQAGRLKELEATAEQLRLELSDPRAEVSATRYENAAGPHSPTELNPRVLRTAAFYVEGLSASQRRLLLAAAVESDLPVAPVATEVNFFFSPERAGLRLPATLPPPVVEKIASYVEARRTLLRELLDAFEHLPSGDSAQWRDLAARQAPAFAALEAQADEIRGALQETNGIDSVSLLPVLPADLTARLSEYRDRKQALMRELNASLANTVRAASAPAPGGIAVPVSAFTQKQQVELTALNREKDALRAALAEFRRASGSTQDRKSVDNLLEDFERARQAQELREKYADYRIALFELGLSPAQRRLLIDNALQHLQLPLASGEPLPAP